MGNSNKSKKSAKNSIVGVDLPVLKVDGIAFSAVSETLGQLREGKVNQVDEDQLLSYNFLDTLPGEFFTDLCVLGNVNGRPGCSLLVSECQDEAFLLDTELQGENCRILGVFDGHGKQDGAKVSKCCTLLFQDLVQKQESRCTKSGKKLKINSEVPEKPDINTMVAQPETFFTDSFKFLHETVCSANDFSAKEAGTTATIASIVNNKLHLAWVGDSQAAIFITANEGFDNFIPYFVTSRHNFQTEEEKERVRQNGGRLGHPNNVFGKIDPFSSEPLRIFGKRANMKPGLMISKSLGDSHAHKIGLTCEPSYFSIDFNEKKTFGDLLTDIPDEFNSSLQPQELFIKPQKETSSRRNKRGLSFQQTLGRVGKKVNKTLGSRKKSKNQISGITQGSSKKFDLDASGVNNASGELLDMAQQIKHCILVVGSDGLWDNLSKKDVANLLPTILRERNNNPLETNVGFELGLKAIEKFRATLTDKNDTTSKTDDISVVASVLF